MSVTYYASYNLAHCVFDPLKLQAVAVHTKEWWDKPNGNAYFSAQITLTDSEFGRQVLHLPFQNGYGSHSFCEAISLLRELGYVDDNKLHSSQATSDGRRLHYLEFKQEGCLKRSVKLWGQPN